MSRKLVLTIVIICSFLLVALVLFFGVSTKPTPAPSIPGSIRIKEETIVPTTENFRLNHFKTNVRKEYWNWRLTETSTKLTFSYTFNHNNVKKTHVSQTEAWDIDYIKYTLNNDKKEITIEIIDISKARNTNTLIFKLDANIEVQLIIEINGIT